MYGYINRKAVEIWHMLMFWKSTDGRGVFFWVLSLTINNLSPELQTPSLIIMRYTLFCVKGVCVWRVLSGTEMQCRRLIDSLNKTIFFLILCVDISYCLFMYSFVYRPTYDQICFYGLLLLFICDYCTFCSHFCVNKKENPWSTI